MGQTFGTTTYYKPTKKASLGGDEIADLKIKQDLSNLQSIKGEGTEVQTITMSGA